METTTTAAAFHARAAHHHLEHLADADHQLHGARSAELQELADRLAELAASYIDILESERLQQLAARLGIDS